MEKLRSVPFTIDGIKYVITFNPTSKQINIEYGNFPNVYSQLGYFSKWKGTNPYKIYLNSFRGMAKNNYSFSTIEESLAFIRSLVIFSWWK